MYLLDIFPTLCDLAGVSVPDSVEGISFAKTLENASYHTRKNLYFAYNDMIRAVKDRRYKLIEYRNTTFQTQLFDLLEDPDETTDISDRPEYREKVEELRKLLFLYRDSWETDHIYSKQFWGKYNP